MLTSVEMAERLGVTAGKLRTWVNHRLIAGRRTNDKNAWLLEPKGVNSNNEPKSEEPTRQEGPRPVPTDTTASCAV